MSGILLLGSSLVSTYLGLVASRARPLVQGAFGGSTGTAMVRSAHVSTDNITALKIVMGNFNCGNPDVTIASAGQTITASVEYPPGTLTRINFGGVAQGSIASFGLITSDSTIVSIPTGTLFWIRMYVTGGPGWNNWQNSFLGEAISLSGSAQTDLTMSGTITNSGAQSMPPLAIIGQTTQPSVIIVGDSIAFGLFDVEDSSSSATGFDSKVGIVARSLGSVPFVNISVSGMKAQTWIANSTGKKQLLGVSSHLITQLGVNDMGGGQTSAQITSDAQSIWNIAKAINSATKCFQATITPESTSTDSWATTGNQTPVIQPVRTTFNTAVRATLSGANGFYDLTQPLETSQNSDIWIAPPAATPDGIHPNQASYALVAAANLIPTPTYP